MAKNSTYKYLLLNAALILLFILIFSACGESSGYGENNYRLVPGVTAYEIDAVNRLRSQYDEFVIGLMLSTETFENENNEVRGFAAYISAWLTELFEIPFVPALFTWGELLEGLEDGTIHFTGEITPESAWWNHYYATDPIVYRSLMYFKHIDTPTPDVIAETRLPRYILLRGTDIAAFVEYYVGDRFEAVYISDIHEAYEMLRTGYADALVAEYARTAFWDAFPDIEAVQFTPMIYSPVPLSTQKRELNPIISIVQKAMDNNAKGLLDDLFEQGYREYLQHKLFQQLTDEEIAFIRTNPVVRLGMRFYDYPISFYNDRNRAWEGMSKDTLREVEKLTGLRFEISHPPDVPTHVLMEMLENGELDIVAQLIQTEDRKRRFLFPQNKYLEDRVVFISRIEKPNINVTNIYGASIGIAANTAHVDIFNEWFPNHTGVVLFETRNETFDALINNEIDFVFNNHNALLYYTHFREVMDLKVNITLEEIFDTTVITTFAFNKEQEILHSIVDKTLALIDVNTLFVQWRHRTYDYRMQSMRELVFLMVLAGLLAGLVIVLLVVMHVRSRRARVNLNGLVEKRTDELATHSALLTTLFNDIPDVIFAKNTELRYTHVNNAFMAVYQGDGKKDETLIVGKNETELGMPEELVEYLNNTDTVVMQSGKKTVVEDHIPHVDGKVLLYETIKTPLIQNGKTIGMLGIARDITDRKQAELAAEERHIYSMKLSESLSRITKSQDIFANNLVASIEMITREVAAALDVQRVTLWKVNEDESELDSILAYDATQNEHSVENDYSMLNHALYLQMLKESRLIVIDELSVDKEINETYKTNLCAMLEAPIRIDGKLYGVIGFEQLYTEKYPVKRVWTAEEKTYATSLGDVMALVISGDEKRKAHEAAAIANQTKSDFLASMSHEIRTPMNSIIGFSELALDDDVSAKTRDYLNKIRENSGWLMNIINDILDISKIESGKMELEHVPFDMQKLFMNCRAAIMPKALDKNLTLHFYAEPSIGKMPLGDPTKLRQILMNLLSNAVKFTSTGIIKLMSDIKHIGENTITMYFEVKDSGIGMTKGQLDRIFEPFMQAESGTTRRFGGTGLGLPITKNMIEMMGGRLQVDSAPGIGSRFSFTLTFDTIDIKEGESTDARIIMHNMKRPAFSGDVLLCEDNVMNQQMICEHLARVGLKTTVAENGKIGVDKVKERIRSGQKMFDLIFMDIHMPVMDGLEAVERILEYKTGVPIVALTANVMAHDRLLYKERGMNDYLGKPFTTQELWRCLVQFLEPVGWQDDDESAKAKMENELQKQLIHNFVRFNTNKYKEISDALKKDDIKTAHRLAHTLKGNAGQLNKMLLQRAAHEVENLLKDEKNSVTPAQMNALEIELNAVLAELTPLANITPKKDIKYLDRETSIKILNALEPVVKDSDSDAFHSINDLRRIKGADELIKYLEEFDFKSASNALEVLRQKEGFV